MLFGYILGLFFHNPSQDSGALSKMCPSGFKVQTGLALRGDAYSRLLGPLIGQPILER
jgi:hypothetical protein